MTTNRILTVGGLALLTTVAQAQSGISVGGRVVDTQGIALAGVTISVKGSSRGAISDTEGKFVLPGLPEGKHVLVLRYLGYETLSVPVVIKPHKHRGGTFPLGDFVLSEGEQALQSVEVVGRQERSYKSTQSFSGTKTALAIQDIPQSIGYVTKELALDQGVSTVSEAIRNVSGINTFSVYNDFSIRGFRVLGNRNSGNLLNGMRAQSSFWSPQSLGNIERVEVIKGPASALFGNASPGGVVNRVTKKPLPMRQGLLRASLGSYGEMGLQGDFTGPLTHDESLLYRLNVGYSGSDSFRDMQKSQGYTLAPSISYVPKVGTRINLDMVYHYRDAKLDRGQTIFSQDRMFSTPISQAIAAPDDYLKERTLSTTLSLSQDLGKGLGLNAIYMYSTYDEDMREHTAVGYLYGADGQVADKTKATLSARTRQNEDRNQAINLFLNYDKQLGKLSSKLLVGYDYFQTDRDLYAYAMQQADPYLLADGTPTAKVKKGKMMLNADGSLKLNTPLFDLANPFANVQLRWSDGGAAKYTWANLAKNKPYRQSSHGIYVQEHLKYTWLQVLLGLRQELFVDILNKGISGETKVTQHTLLPRVGIVATVAPTVNIYGTWVKGYDPQEARVQSNPRSGGPFDSKTSQLWEAGMKSELFSRRLSVTLALFHLTQNGTLYSAQDPEDPANSDYRIQIGREVSKGVEVDMMGYILPHWSLSTSYTFDRAYIARSAQESQVGQQLPNTPRHAFNVWSKYVFAQGPLRNLGIGGGFRYVSERNGYIDGPRGGNLVLPSYCLTNLALYYQVGHVQLQVNADNIFDRIHWTGGYDTVRIFPGKPRTIGTTFSYRF